MKKLFKIKRTIASLSDDRINAKPVFGLIFSLLLMTVPMIFGFNYDFIKIIKKTLEPIQNIQGPEKLSIYFEIITGLFVMFFVYLGTIIILTIVINWIIKRVLSLFKKDITLYKLLNISIYTCFMNTFFIALFFSLIAILVATSLTMSIKSDFQADVIVFLPITVINLFSLGLYIYGVKMSIKK